MLVDATTTIGIQNNNYVIRSHMQQHLNGQLKFHYMTKDKLKRKFWEKNIRKGREFVARDHHQNPLVCKSELDVHVSF